MTERSPQEATEIVEKLALRLLGVSTMMLALTLAFAGVLFVIHTFAWLIGATPSPPWAAIVEVVGL